MIELAVAAAVIASVAAFAGGSGSRRPQASPQARWDSRALPAITLLVDDLAVLRTDSAAGSPAAAATAHDAATLASDLARARLLGPPPAPALRSIWADCLSLVDETVAAADSASGTGSASRMPALEASVDRAGSSILGLASKLEAAK